MRIKDGKGKTTERVFLVSASVLTVLLCFYVIWLVRLLVQKSNTVFSLGNNSNAGVPTFDFAGYDKLMTEMGSSTLPVATSTASIEAAAAKSKATTTVTK